MSRRNDSVMSTPSISTASPTAPSLASLTLENDKLARDNACLQKRNEELTQQSELDQNVFQDTYEALAAKDSEITSLEGTQKELKERIRRNVDASSETIHTLQLQLQDLAMQLEKAQEMAIKREAMLARLENQQQQLPTKDVSEQQMHHQRELDELSAAHLAQIREKNKTIHFLRCREGRAYKRIDRLMKRLADTEVRSGLGSDDHAC